MNNYYVLFTAFTAILMTIEPPGLVPLFLAITRGMSPEKKLKTIVEGCLISYGVLIAAALCGNVILSALGISIPAFRVAGGLLLLFIGFEMVFDKFGNEPPAGLKEGEEKGKPDTHSVSAFPLAIPLISGPGAISTTMMFSGKLTGFVNQVFLFLIITVCMIITYAVLLFANRIDKFLGESGRSALMRIVGILLSAMALQLTVEGFLEGLANGSFGNFK